MFHKKRWIKSFAGEKRYMLAAFSLGGPAFRLGR